MLGGLVIITLSMAFAFIASGDITLSSKQGLDSIGFNFNTGEVVGNEGDVYYYQEDLWTNHLEGGIKEMGMIDVSECPVNGYEKRVNVTEGNTYCIKAKDGSFAKISVVSKTSKTIKFLWEHQRDGTNSFTEPGDVVIQEINLNYTLIGIIIILLIIIIILWQLR